MKPLSNFDLLKYAKLLKIPDFRGVFARDELPQKPRLQERGVINLAKKKEIGSHWTAYIKNGNIVTYHDPFGNLKPPKELEKYLKNCAIYYNYKGKQKFGTVICGHLCLEFLNEL